MGLDGLIIVGWFCLKKKNMIKLYKLYIKKMKL